MPEETILPVNRDRPRSMSPVPVPVDDVDTNRVVGQKSTRGGSVTILNDGSMRATVLKDRPLANPALARLPSPTDFSKIAIISREAGHTFTPKYQEKLASKSGYSATAESQGLVSSAARSTFAQRTQYRNPGLNMYQRVSFMLNDKEIPHILAVIEGAKDVAGADNILSVDQGPTRGTNAFCLIGERQGKNALGANDAKQNYFVLVRQDMRHVYQVTEVDVPRGDKKIPCMAITYQTIDNKKYQTLIVHIPNEFIKSASEIQKTHEAFEQYARDTAHEATVTGYIGDTNYKVQMTANSYPSTSGFEEQADGTMRSTQPFSSSASIEKHFMQHVPLGTHEGVSVLQPSVLHHVKVEGDPDSRARPGIDHPSIMGRTLHSKGLKGRPPESNSGKKTQQSWADYFSNLYYYFVGYTSS
ncbi:MAG: hypothetical protein RIG26_04335 [Thalassospira sp.]|uniref:hypothetical protein n=1 Tax=Thalassospira sp. TaxID=1912094 RepID=UPI0032EF7FC5